MAANTVVLRRTPKRGALADPSMPLLKALQRKVSVLNVGFGEKTPRCSLKVFAGFAKNVRSREVRRVSKRCQRRFFGNDRRIFGELRIFGATLRSFRRFDESSFAAIARFGFARYSFPLIVGGSTSISNITKTHERFEFALNMRR